MKEVLIFALINLLTSTLSGAAGGGGALVGIPVLILLGLSPASAIASTKFTALGLSAGVSSRFFREKLANRRMVLVLTVSSSVGALLGSIFLVKVGVDHQQGLQTATGLFIILVGIPFLYLKNLGIEQKNRSKFARAGGYVLFFIVATVSGTMNAGTGAIQTMILLVCFGMTALTVNATRRIVQIATSLVSLTVLILAGLPDYRFGIAAFITAALGGYLGAHIAIKKGNRFVINLFAITSAILALQLLWR